MFTEVPALSRGRRHRLGEWAVAVHDAHLIEVTRPAVGDRLRPEAVDLLRNINSAPAHGRPPTMNLHEIAAELRLLNLVRQEYLYTSYTLDADPKARDWNEVLHRSDDLLDRATCMLEVAPPIRRDHSRCYMPRQREELESQLAEAGLDVQPARGGGLAC